MIDWNAQQFMAIIVPYLQKYGKAKKSDILEIVGDHISEKQLRKFINELKEIDYLRSEGTTINTIYILGETFLKQSAITNKALEIGFKHLKEQGEI